MIKMKGDSDGWSGPPGVGHESEDGAADGYKYPRRKPLHAFRRPPQDFTKKLVKAPHIYPFLSDATPFICSISINFPIRVARRPQP